MKLNKITIFLIIGLITASFQPIFGEQYYYLEHHKLPEPPVFCAGEFKDQLLPEAETILIEETKQAVFDWKSRLVEYTGNQEGWDFQFKTVPEDYKASDVSDCDVFFYYKRQSNKDLDEPHGFSLNLLGFSGITIYYLENVYSGDIKEIEIDGEKNLSRVVSHYENRVSPYIDFIIKHEIGHSLGLDHPSMDEFSVTITSDGSSTFSSIMFGNDPTIFEDGYVRVITDYDIRAMVNLYGEEGIKPSTPFWEFVGTILFGGLMGIIGFVFYRRRKIRMKKQKENWKKNKRSFFIGLGLILGLVVLAISVTIMIPGPSDNQSKFESVQFDGVSVLFPKIPDNEWTITTMDIVEGENVFYDRYGILDIEGWRYYNSKIDSQLFVTIAKIDNLKDPSDYFDFGLNLFSTLNEYGSPLIFDESAVKSIDADKCTAKKLSLEAGAIIFMVICHKENFLYQVSSSTTYKTDLTETYGIDFANQISEKIR